MADPTGAQAAAGDLAKTSGAEIISRKCDGTGVSKGDLCMMDTNGLVAIAADATGTVAWGFCVALEDGAASADVRVAIGNTYIYCTAGEAIIPFNLCDTDATSGRVGQLDEPAASALNSIFGETEVQDEIDLVKDYYGRAIGRYIGHQLEEVGDPTDAADGDIVIIRLGH